MISTEEVCIGTEGSRFDPKLVWQVSVEIKLSFRAWQLDSSLFPDLLDVCPQASHMRCAFYFMGLRWRKIHSKHWHIVSTPEVSDSNSYYTYKLCPHGQKSFIICDIQFYVKYIGWTQNKGNANLAVVWQNFSGHLVWLWTDAKIWYTSIINL